MRILRVIALLIIGFGSNSVLVANNSEYLFLCTGEEDNKVTLETILKEGNRYFRLNSFDADIHSTDWMNNKNMEPKMLSEGFSRGAQAIILFKYNGCSYLFEDSLIAREIGKIPSHDVIKTVTVECKSKKIPKNIKCVGSDDGVSSLAHDILEKIGMEEYYFKEKGNDTILTNPPPKK